MLTSLYEIFLLIVTISTLCIQCYVIFLIKFKSPVVIREYTYFLYVLFIVGEHLLYLYNHKMLFRYWIRICSWYFNTSLSSYTFDWILDTWNWILFRTIYFNDIGE